MGAPTATVVQAISREMGYLIQQKHDGHALWVVLGIAVSLACILCLKTPLNTWLGDSEYYYDHSIPVISVSLTWYGVVVISLRCGGYGFV